MHVVLLPNCMQSVLVHSCGYSLQLHCTLTVLLGKFAICRLAIAIALRVLHYSASLYKQQLATTCTWGHLEIIIIMLFMNPTDQTLSVIFRLELVHVPALERTLQWYI